MHSMTRSRGHVDRVEGSGSWGMVPNGIDGREDLLGLHCALAFCFAALFEDLDLD